ncbi:SpoIID/LytB domain-containing protein, partial [Acinetobacter baumannii]
GRFSINDYVARVIDREGDGSNTEAARSLAIAARSYLVQNANVEHGCWHIADATSRQRVSPNPPTAAALSAAWFTADLILQGASV